MGRNGRATVGIPAALVIALSLAGCAGSAVGTDDAQVTADAQTIGASALVTAAAPSTADSDPAASVAWPTDLPTAPSASTDGPTVIDDWTGTWPCAGTLTGFEESYYLKLNTETSPLNTSETFGVLADPALNQGMAPSCALDVLSSKSHSILEIFVHMPKDDVARFANRLEANGFTLHKTGSNPVIDVLKRPGYKVQVAYFPSSSISPYGYVVVAG